MARKHRSKVREPRGRITETTQGALIDGGDADYVSSFVVTGFKAHIVAYVKSRTRDECDRFYKLVKREGLTIRELQNWGDIVAYHVWGADESLLRCTESNCLRNWHYILDAREARRGSGAGAEPMRRRFDKLHPLTQRLILSTMQRNARDSVIAEHKQDMACLDDNVNEGRHTAIGI